ncbi:hypothetical protein [Sorangium sp. So ce363]|uniref:hypothetical protein n=1 Tax=Sorangium sp. So ce363 TaxID=3133304 RepID=UPI003F5DD0DA
MRPAAGDDSVTGLAPGASILTSRAGEQRGQERRERRGRERGERQAIAELLGRLFARRLGRRPTAEEERSIIERARAIGPGEVEDALLDLEADALVRWLAEPLRTS